jgi:hypothetical protein
MLTGNAQLAVAAHVRGCPLCQQGILLCQPPEPPRRRLVARWLPFAVAEGQRSGAQATLARRYVAADIVVDLAITLLAGEQWRVTGQILRDGIGLAACAITLRAGRRSYQQISDKVGFFTFSALLPGRYTLSVVAGQVQVQIRDLELHTDTE